jgi:DNA mismatch repair protein MSH5
VNTLIPEEGWQGLTCDTDAQVDIIHELSLQVLEHGDTLKLASDAVGELDAIVALALAAKKHGWNPPTMTSENVLQIRGGRHPLQELVVDSYIPNDCYLSGGQGEADEDPEGHARKSPPRPPSNLLALTGPNHSGKSVYIKQVALIVYLAHIGSFVPADEAVIGVTDQILTRISTRECVTENESAFAIDLRQISFCLKAASRRSLVLIDEFGKGTRTDDGAGLMSALLDHFLTLGPQSPRMIAATHFHEIFEGRHLENHPQLMFAHMDVHMDMANASSDHPMTFLYKLVPGRSSSSFGGLCASLNGVDRAVVDRAEAISLLLARNEDLGAACAKLGIEDQRQLENAEAAARQYLSLSTEDLLRSDDVRGLLGGILSGGR